MDPRIFSRYTFVPCLSFNQDHTLKIRDRGLVLDFKAISMSIFLKGVRESEEMMLFYEDGDINGKRWVFVVIILLITSPSQRGMLPSVF